MSPRIAFWTSALHREMEAVAAEVALLRAQYPRSVAWGITPAHGVQFSWRHGFGFPVQLHLLFRGAAGVAQHLFDINHLMGSAGDWFHLRAASKHPLVLTLAIAAPLCDVAMLRKVDEFVVEWPAAKDELVALGIHADRIRQILPPVDLERFRAANPPTGPFTVLFASCPDRADWLEGRGVTALLDAAAALPAMRFRFLWRPWGDSLPEVERQIAARGLTNVELKVGKAARMEDEYANAHVTVAPFQDINKCKPSPNSIAESLGCGRPVVVTSIVGLAGLIEESQAGAVCAPTAEALAESLARVERDWQCYAAQTRAVAEQHFSQQTFIAEYGKLYAELMR